MPDQNNETLHHLLDDFGMYKSTLRRNFEDNDRGPEYNHVRELLDRRTQRYTLAEMKELSGFFCTAHDECVVENPEDYSPLQVYAAKKKVSVSEWAQARIEELENARQQATAPQGLTP